LIKIAWDQSFKKIYRKKIKNDAGLKKRFWGAMGLFSKNPFNYHLRTHKLTGKLEGLWAFSVAYDNWLLTILLPFPSTSSDIWDESLPQ
jgi:mRNA-degrading endonuclease YafQ of YafQ-DinJ toxin-antitoxin module